MSEQAALVRKLSLLPPRDPRSPVLFGAVITFSFGLTLVVATLVMVVTLIAFNGPIDHPGLVKPAVISMVGYVFVTNTGWNLDSVLAAFRAGRALFWIRLAQGDQLSSPLAVIGASTLADGVDVGDGPRLVHILSALSAGASRFEPL